MKANTAKTKTANTEQQAESAKPDSDFSDFYDYCVTKHGEEQAMKMLEACELEANNLWRRIQLNSSRQERMRDAITL